MKQKQKQMLQKFERAGQIKSEFMSEKEKQN